MTRSHSDGALLGGLFGIIAAVTYTLANLALRKVATSVDLDWAVWVSANKALPVTLVAWLIVIWRHGRGLTALPPTRLMIPLVATGLLMQFGGNVLFQLALSLGGLALSVPLTFSTIIISSAVLGRMFLQEPIRIRTAAAIGLMMCAVVVLSQGAGEASARIVYNATATTTLLAVLTAAGSGVGFGACGVVIRRCMTSQLSISGMVAVLSTTGLVALVLISLMRIGPAGLAATPGNDFAWMQGAGVFNAVAFFAVSAAYQRLSVVTVNLINTSQAAMAGLAGVLIFDEPLTGWLILGVALTAAGLMIAQSRQPDPAVDVPACPADLPGQPVMGLLPVSSDDDASNSRV